MGVISIESELPNAFSEADEHLVVTLANQAAVSLENSRLHEETLRQVTQLQALHTIDQAIAQSFDQRLMLDILLTSNPDPIGRRGGSGLSGSVPPSASSGIRRGQRVPYPYH